MVTKEALSRSFGNFITKIREGLIVVAAYCCLGADLGVGALTLGFAILLSGMFLFHLPSSQITCWCTIDFVIRLVILMSIWGFIASSPCPTRLRKGDW